MLSRKQFKADIELMKSRMKNINVNFTLLLHCFVIWMAHCIIFLLPLMRGDGQQDCQFVLVSLLGFFV